MLYHGFVTNHRLQYQCPPQVRHEAAEPRREAAGATEAAHRHQAKFLLVTVTFRICLRLYVCIAITKLVKAPAHELALLFSGIIPAQNISKRQKPSAEQAATNAEKSRQKKNPGENKLSPVLTKVST